MKSDRKYPRCSRCGGLLYLDYDGYEHYLTCFECAHSFDLDNKPMRVTQRELEQQRGIKLIRVGTFAQIR